MVYSQKVVACVKVDGKVLRDDGNTVHIPFGSEYSLLIKNLDSVRIQAKVYIDGVDATDGLWLVVPPNGSVDLERFIRDGNMNSGNKLKFIARSKKIEQHRGLKADDGIVRIEYKREKRTQVEDVHITRHHYHDYYHPWHYYWPHVPYYTLICNNSSSFQQNQILGNAQINDTMNWNGSESSLETTCYLASVQNTSNVSYSNNTGNVSHAKTNNPLRSVSARLTKSAVPIDDSGITVPGEVSHQQFSNAGWFPTHDQTEVIVLNLRGAVGEKVVQKAITIKTKKACGVCGKSNKGRSKFCGECGAALELV